MVELLTLLLAGLIASIFSPEIFSTLGLDGFFGFAVGLISYYVCLLADYIWSRVNGVETRRNIFGVPIWRAWAYAVLCSLVLAPFAADWNFGFRGGFVFLGALLLGGLILSVEVGIRNYLYDLKRSRQPKNWR